MIQNPSIQWFPGHMNKARNEIKEIMPDMDVVIEVIDARIPFSSENPMVAALRSNEAGFQKPVIKILNKADLADPELTQIWIEQLEQQSQVKAIACDDNKANDVKRIIQMCKDLIPNKVGTGRQIKVLIMGIPNVGKSTLINTLAGRSIARTGDEPAVTKSQQLIKIDDDIMLYDTPGMLWPKIENPNSGFRLAATGGIKDTAFDFSDVAGYTAEYLIKAYPELLKERYKIDELPQSDWEFFEMAGRNRGFLKKGGVVDTYRMSEILINELRSGQLGRITLETPAMRIEEDKLVEQLRAEAEERRLAKIEEKKLRKKRARKNRK
ncbi:ribosome biogenesis GTPase YlqF [Psychrobacter sp. YP14]|uniref:Ribosome biogenesis GTPase A n=3 Tax=Psychrobacter TaxID=497 RepID=A0A844LZH5_9GAMM|nr:MULTISPECIES: ribosome biogenesis GTPase YlqF [Psychrobacter]AWT48225.1 ribosome biogenesis GTPase YlqF [Psychrobacter sp. YP14]MUG31647.1 ribosome biogenesis GTPase YlqF [Psychrobacter sanguinis]